MENKETEMGFKPNAHKNGMKEPGYSCYCEDWGEILSALEVRKAKRRRRKHYICWNYQIFILRQGQASPRQAAHI